MPRWKRRAPAGRSAEAARQIKQLIAALVEETAAASQSLDDQARHLVASVALFRIDAAAQVA